MDKASLAIGLSVTSMSLAMFVRQESNPIASPLQRIEAQEYVLVDQDGSARAILGTKNGTIGLSILSKQGQVLSSIGCYSARDEGSIKVLDPASGEQVVVGMLGTAYVPGIAIYDGKRERAFLGMDDTGSAAPWLRLYGKEGEARIQTGIDTDGDAVLAMHDQAEDYAILLGADAKKHAGYLSIYGGDSEHRDLIDFGVSKEGQPFLIITSPLGDTLYKAP